MHGPTRRGHDPHQTWAGISALISIPLNRSGTRAREEFKVIRVLDDDHVATRGTYEEIAFGINLGLRFIMTKNVLVRVITPSNWKAQCDPWLRVTHVCML